MNIKWELPPFRDGWRGRIDKFIGPGATKAEKDIQLYVPILAVVVMVASGLYLGFDWNLGQYLVAALIAWDMVGGIATNLTSTAKRWYFREGTGFNSHISFVAVHIIQISLVGYFFLNFDIVWIVSIYAFLLLASVVILKTPLYLQRPVSGLLFALAMALSIYVFKSPEHLEWFLPLFFFKLLISHIVREEPYRPVNEADKNV